MIAAVLGFLATGTGRLVAAALVGALLLSGVYQTGVNAERKRGQAASLRAELAIVRADLDIARKSEADALARSAALDLGAQALQEDINELEASVRRAPAVAGRRVGRADAERLRRIR